MVVSLVQASFASLNAQTPKHRRPKVDVKSKTDKKYDNIR